MGLCLQDSGFNKVHKGEGDIKMAVLCVKDLTVEQKRVLLRVDFNVPIEDGKIADDRRIRAALPTIQHIVDRGGRVVAVSHLGRPKGKVVPELSLKPVAKRLGELLEMDVQFCPEVVGSEAEKMSQGLKDGEVMLLENVRFVSGEEKNDMEFSSKLAELGDVYVNDAFATAHRAHSSTVGVARLFSERGCGFLMEKELKYLSMASHHPEKPYVAVIGGAKVSSKISLLRHLMDKVDKFLIGGGMMFTFYKAQGLSVGASIVEEDAVDTAMQILRECGRKDVHVLLPLDVVIADSFSNDARKKVVAKELIPEGWMGLDIGPLSVRVFRDALKGAKTILWNGPMGVFEFDNFSDGTRGVASAIADVTAEGAISIVGGGDTASAVAKVGLEDKMSYVSTGGGASLAFLAGQPLPAIEALEVSK